MTVSAATLMPILAGLAGLADALPPLAAIASLLGDALVRASVQGGLLIALAWLLCRLAPRIPAGVRAGLWWLACLKLLVTLAWPQPIALAVLPPTAAPGAAGPGAAGSTGEAIHDIALDARNRTAVTTAMTAVDRSARAMASPTTTNGAGPSLRTWLTALLAAVWLAGVCWRFARLARDHRRLRGIIDRATPAASDAIALYEQLCATRQSSRGAFTPSCRVRRRPCASPPRCARRKCSARGGRSSSCRRNRWIGCRRSSCR
jgi:hypothetical protein